MLDTQSFSLLEAGETPLYGAMLERGRPVLVKVWDGDDARGAQVLEQEFAFRRHLSSDWALIPEGLSRKDGRLALVLGDPGAVPFRQAANACPVLLPRLALAAELAAAVRAMHAAGVVHGDIRPAHILARADGGRVWLTGFAHATARGQVPEGGLTDPSADALPYMSPEHTGRTGRIVDERSDLYSLGVVLYELLAGVLPFHAQRRMEWIHAHVARVPAPPRERADLPEAVSAIVVKLLAKEPASRYQSAATLEQDLRRCVATLRQKGTIPDFVPGESEVLLGNPTPQRFLGRTSELAHLTTAAARVAADGRAEGVLVQAEAGAGKSALAAAFQRRVEPHMAWFATAKCEPRDQPYAALGAALRSLVIRALAAAPEALEALAAGWAHAFGDDVAFLLDLVPELAPLVAVPSRPASLPLMETRARVHRLLAGVLAGFARQRHFLVLVIDDVQWADVATLDFIGELLGAETPAPILFLGLARPSQEMALLRLASHRRIETMDLVPLSVAETRDLVAGLLRAPTSAVGGLAELVWTKTGGNPFFVCQFLSVLAHRGGLSFDPASGRWVWDAAVIAAAGIADNVATLIAGKILRLEPDLQKLLMFLASLGSQFDAELLATVEPVHGGALEPALGKAVEAGYVIATPTGHRFAHDKIRDAAYQLIDPSSRATWHLGLARVLAGAVREGAAARLFDAVDQYGLCLRLLEDANERLAVAELYLDAARRARRSGSYEAALGLVRTATALLPQDRWNTCYRTSFELAVLGAECAAMHGEHAYAEAQLAAAGVHAEELVDAALATRLQVSLLTALDRSDEAVRTGLGFLSRLGPAWSFAPGDTVEEEYRSLVSRLGTQPVGVLIDAPALTDPLRLAAMEVLVEVTSPASFIDRRLHDLVPLRMVNLVLEHGLCDAAAFAFEHAAMVIGPAFGDYALAHALGQLGLDLVNRRGFERFRAKVEMCFGSLVSPWTRPLAERRDLIRKSFDSALAAGDANFAAYSCNNLVTNMLSAGEPLVAVEAEIERGLAYAAGVRLVRVELILKAQARMVQQIRRGIAADPQEEAATEALLEADPRLAVAAFCYWTRKLQCCVLSGRFAEAAQAREKAEHYAWTCPYFLETAVLALFGGLALSLPRAAGEEGPWRDAFRRHAAQMAHWAAHSPSNFEGGARLLAAEAARLDGRDVEAMTLYERAVQGARTLGLSHHEALASECAARFHASRGHGLIASAFRRYAASAYEVWGAHAKAAELGSGSGGIVQSDPAVPRLEADLDISLMLDGSRALSAEIVLPQLIERLLTLAMQHAGADRGLLTLVRDGRPYAAASAVSEAGGLHVWMSEVGLYQCPFPVSLVNVVLRTRTTLMLADVRETPEFGDDPFFAHAPRAVLALPLKKGGEVVGVLYLENAHLPDAFSASRQALLEVLGSQAAISLENARLYAELQTDIARRKTIEQELRRSRAVLAAAQSMMQIGSWYWEAANRTILWSDELFRILGLDPLEHKPSFQLFWSRVHPEDKARLKAAIHAVRASVQSASVEFRIVLPGVEVRHIECIIPAMLSAAESRGDFVGTVMDVTEKHRADERLRAAQAELERVAGLTTMGELVASVAHEISQPLAAIVANASAGIQWLKRSPPRADQAEQVLARIAAQGTKAGDVIRGLRSISAKSDAHMAPFDVPDAVDEAIALLADRLRKAQVLVRRTLSPSERIAHGDRALFQQVVINLAGNAIEAMRGSSGARTLSITTRSQADAFMEIEVADTGEGIPPEQVARIFDPFFSTKPDGMGMGLAICRSVVEAHGGTLGVDTGPTGTRFFFSFPRGDHP
ncbi:trifunctional serine/threonine-protein kinase/ATP-binding protein/sensor histidine kinase [Azorhizobium caulinodans]|uniref:trifunctional serine/threonine-protein kinase/ATP-binding protein/sensor histidine kinase n=1 Tax=Azorhizobium caulinodans TaxID=7 RepID=UPI00130540F0|nr:ATP-binding sensor histidine kinase [Azorhizobium caulinodans]